MAMGAARDTGRDYAGERVSVGGGGGAVMQVVKDNLK